MINDEMISKKLDKIFSNYPETDELKDLYQEVEADVRESAQHLLDSKKETDSEKAVEQAIKDLGDLNEPIKLADEAVLGKETNEYQYSVTQIKTINLKASFGDVKIYPSKDDQLHIHQFQRPKSKSYRLKIDKSGNILNLVIPKPDWFSLKSLFIHPRSLVKIAIPKQFQGGLNLNDQAGSLNIEDLHSLGQIKINVKSGVVNFKNIYSDKIICKINSGTMNLNHIKTIFDLSIHAGTISGKNLSGAGNFSVETGTIKLDWLKLAGDITLIEKTGTIKSVQTSTQNFAFKLQSATGTVKIKRSNINYELKAIGAAIGKTGFTNTNALPLISCKVDSGTIKLA